MGSVITCTDLPELYPEYFNKDRMLCCYDCHEYTFLGFMKRGKLDNGWSYDICCSNFYVLFPKDKRKESRVIK